MIHRYASVITVTSVLIVRDVAEGE